nr:hypothetical protein Iba_chr11aCG13040 [Ipomoea batatas]
MVESLGTLQPPNPSIKHLLQPLQVILALCIQGELSEFGWSELKHHKQEQRMHAFFHDKEEAYKDAMQWKATNKTLGG